VSGGLEQWLSHLQGLVHHVGEQEGFRTEVLLFCPETDQDSGLEGALDQFRGLLSMSAGAVHSISIPGYLNVKIIGT